MNRAENGKKEKRKTGKQERAARKGPLFCARGLFGDENNPPTAKARGRVVGQDSNLWPFDY